MNIFKKCFVVEIEREYVDISITKTNFCKPFNNKLFAIVYLLYCVLKNESRAKYYSLKY